MGYDTKCRIGFYTFFNGSFPSICNICARIKFI